MKQISISLFLFLAVFLTSHAQTTYVVTNTNLTGNGSMSVALSSAKSNPGSVITFSEDLDGIVITTPTGSTSGYYLNFDVTIRGNGVNKTILKPTTLIGTSTNGMFSVFPDANVVIENLTITETAGSIAISNES